MKQVCTVAAILALAVTLDATVIIPTEFREVVAAATVIVRGRVTDVRTIATSRKRADTVATVAVEATLKGEPAAFASVRVPGGQIGRDRWIVVGAPTFTVGDQALFFLSRGPDNALFPVGLSLGVYRLKPDPRTGRAFVNPPAILGPTAWPGPIVPGDPRRRPMQVQEFEALIRFVLNAQRGSKGAPR